MDIHIDRRNFIKLSGLAGAGLMLNGMMHEAYANQESQDSGHESRVIANFLPVIFIDDIIRVVCASETIIEPIRFSLTHPTPRPLGRVAYTDIARVSRVVHPGSTENMIDLLDEVWSKWNRRHGMYQNEMLPEELAFISGWLMLRGLDHHLGESYSEAERLADLGNPMNYPEIGIYHDTHLLREFLISKQGKEEALNNIAQVSADDIADAFMVMGERSLIKIHSFEPDSDDIIGWIERNVKWKRSQDDLARQYAEVYHSPDPALKSRYIDEPRFYDREDPIIKRARSIQNGTVAPIDFDLKAAGYVDPIHRFRDQSQYAQAMAKGWFNIKHLNAYLYRVISRNEFMNRLW